MSIDELKPIQRTIIQMICHGHRVHWNIKQMYLFGPSAFGGYEIPILEVSTNEHQWVMLRDHLERENSTKQLLMVSLSYSKLALGGRNQLLSLTNRGYAPWS